MSDDKEPQYEDMTLRDLFAMAALVGMGNWFPHEVENFTERRKVMARWAYDVADCMVEARK